MSSVVKSVSMSGYRPSLDTKAAARSSRIRIYSSSSANLMRIRHQILVWGSKQGCLVDNKRVQKEDKSTRSIVVYNTVDHPEASQNSKPRSNFLNWIVGVVLTIVLPFFNHKWGPLLKIKNEVDTAVATIEVIVDTVEKVAERVEKAAEHISDDLPEGGRFRKAVDFVEHVAETTSKDAHLVGDFIDMIQEAEEKVEACVEEIIVHDQHPKESDRRTDEH